MAWTKLNIAAGVAAAAVIALQWGKIETQKTEVASLQSQLQQAAQQSEKQLASIKELETRDETMARGLRQIVAASTQSSARKPPPAAPVAVANPSGVFPTGKGLGSLVEHMMKNPDYIKAMGEQQAELLKTQYAPLVKQLNLTPGQRDAFYKLIMDNATNAMVQGLAMMSSTNKSAALSAVNDAQNSLQAQMRLLLGDSGAAQFQEFQTTLPDRMMFEQINKNFDAPLTDDQQQRLLQLMINERKNPANGMDPTTGKPAFPAANPAAQLEQGLQIQDQINQQVYQQAAGFLSPGQLQSLANSQSNFLNLTRGMMPMMQQMLGTNSTVGPAGQ